MSERIEAIRKENNAWLEYGSTTKRVVDTTALLDHIDKLESALKEVDNIEGRTGEDSWLMSEIAGEALSK